MMRGTIVLVVASILWGVVHSFLASHAAKDFIRRISGAVAYDRLYRFSYNFFALASLFPIAAMLLAFPDKALYIIPSPWVYLAGIIQGLAVLFLISTLMQTDPFDFIGLKQLTEIGPASPPVLVTDGWYAYVRHPLYLGSLVLIWLIPNMTVNRLALIVTFTLYTVIGAYFEERKLLRDFGDRYAQYRARIPMLIPKIVNRKS
jgi:protein-S-isoprenylcysteine O-methyltransferase Ste14